MNRNKQQEGSPHEKWCMGDISLSKIGGLFSVIAFFLYLGASYTTLQYYREVIATPMEDRPSNDDDYTFSEQTESHHPESPEPQHARPRGHHGRKHKKSS